MLLAVDVGNTQTVIGLFEGEKLACHFRIATDAESTSDELRIVLRGVIGLSEYSEGDIDHMALSSVVPVLEELWCEVAGHLGVPVLEVSSAIRTGLAMRYDAPSEIGADRIADAVAAIASYGAPVIVVDLGTATNIEVIDRDGAFLGGIIAPGLMTSADALFSAAARLSKVDLIAPAHAIGTSTRTAVQSGLVFGEVARIDGLVERVFRELGYTAPVVATGGLASRIAPLSSTITAVDENLTLLGLRLLYEKNTGADGGSRNV